MRGQMSDQLQCCKQKRPNQNGNKLGIYLNREKALKYEVKAILFDTNLFLHNSCDKPNVFQRTLT